MPPSLPPAAAILASYLGGAIPFAWLAARFVSGIDIRTVGSGNIGATNAARVLGRGWFLGLFALDAAKGAAAVLVFARIGTGGPVGDELLRVACGLAAVLGHVFSVFFRFRGGKGVATGAGMLAALAPWAALCALGVFLVVLVAFRFVSLASIVAAAALAPLALLFRASVEVVVVAGLVAALVVVRHRANLARIVSGSEPRIFGRPHGG